VQALQTRPVSYGVFATIDLYDQGNEFGLPPCRIAGIAQVTRKCGIAHVCCCYSVLQCTAVDHNVLQCCWSVLRVLQCVAVCCVCCSMLQCLAVCCIVLQCIAACCSGLQRVASCCSVLQRVAACCDNRYSMRSRQHTFLPPATMLDKSERGYPDSENLFLHTDSRFRVWRVINLEKIVSI